MNMYIGRICIYTHKSEYVCSDLKEKEDVFNDDGVKRFVNLCHVGKVVVKTVGYKRTVACLRQYCHLCVIETEKEDVRERERERERGCERKRKREKER